MSFHFQNVVIFRNVFSLSKCERFPEKLKRSSQIFCGTQSFWIFGGTRSSQIFCGTQSFQILGGTGSFKLRISHFSKNMLSFSKCGSFFKLCFHFQKFSGEVEVVISNFLWHTVISNSLWHTVISNSLWHTVIYKFSVTQSHSEHNSFDTSSFNPKGNHRLPWAPNFCKLSLYEKTSFVEKSIKTRQPAMDIQEKWRLILFWNFICPGLRKLAKNEVFIFFWKFMYRGLRRLSKNWGLILSWKFM